MNITLIIREIAHYYQNICGAHRKKNTHTFTDERFANHSSQHKMSGYILNARQRHVTGSVRAHNNTCQGLMFEDNFQDMFFFLPSLSFFLSFSSSDKHSRVHDPKSRLCGDRGVDGILRWEDIKRVGRWWRGDTCDFFVVSRSGG